MKVILLFLIFSLSLPSLTVAAEIPLLSGVSPSKGAKSPVSEITLLSASAFAGGKATARARIIIPAGMHLSLQPEYDYLKVVQTNGWMNLPAVYPPGKIEKTLTNYYREVTLTRDFIVPADAAIGTHAVTLELGAQLCDDTGTCYPPQQKRVTLTLNVQPAGSAVAQSGTPVVSSNTPRSEKPEQKTPGLALILLFAFIGGIILNVMPCVLPVLSLKAFSLVKQAQGDNGAILKGSLFYTAGILVSFGILAAVTAALKVSGELVGWGFQFQNPWFVFLLLAFVILFALSMFDVFIISLPGMTAASKAAGTKGNVGSFMNGVVAVLLATPCTAPFLGTALGFAFTQGIAVIFLVFFAIALGLALPFLLIGFFPALIRKLPKPGGWMNVLKEVMGFLLILTGVWLFSVLASETGPKELIAVLLFLVGLAFAGWLYGKISGTGMSALWQWAYILAAATALTLGALTFLHFPKITNAAVRTEAGVAGGAWENFSEELLDNYRKAGEPVFIDFTAEWCLTCKVNEGGVLLTKDIASLFRQYRVRTLRADFTTYDETLLKRIKSLGKAGVPVYALYLPGREEPIVFPELLTQEMVKQAVETNLGQRVAQRQA